VNRTALSGPAARSGTTPDLAAKSGRVVMERHHEGDMTQQLEKVRCGKEDG